MKKTFYKNALIIFILLNGLFLSSAIAFNYYVDPANQFFHAKAFAEDTAKLLLNKKQVLVNTNYNERLLQKLMLEKINKQPDVLVLGSSHSQAITQNLFAPLSFYNASVSGADLEDDLAFYYLYQTKGWQPKILIICLDPWILDQKFAPLFMEEQASQQWKTTLLFEYYDARKLFSNVSTISIFNEKINGVFFKYSQLLSIDFLKASIVKASTQYFVALFHLPQNNWASCYTLLPDGARIPTTIQENTSADASVLALINHLQESPQFYKNSSARDVAYTNMFESFIHYLVNKHIQVIFYFPPMENMAYSEIVEKNPNFQSVKLIEKYFVSIATKYNLKIIGAYDPKKLNLQPEDFIDSSHLKPEGIQKIFKS